MGQISREKVEREMTMAEKEKERGNGKYERTGVTQKKTGGKGQDDKIRRRECYRTDT